MPSGDAASGPPAAATVEPSPDAAADDAADRERRSCSEIPTHHRSSPSVEDPRRPFYYKVSTGQARSGSGPQAHLSPTRPRSALFRRADVDRTQRRALLRLNDPGSGGSVEVVARTQKAPSRRPNGALEAEVLSALWDAETPLTATQVLAELPGTLAYTTVMTILTRLHAKGVVSRAAVGRAYAYRPMKDRAETAAQRMAQVLERTEDQTAVLSRFVAHLSPPELDALRAAVRAGARRS